MRCANSKRSRSSPTRSQSSDRDHSLPLHQLWPRCVQIHNVECQLAAPPSPPSFVLLPLSTSGEILQLRIISFTMTSSRSVVTSFSSSFFIDFSLHPSPPLFPMSSLLHSSPPILSVSSLPHPPPLLLIVNTILSKASDFFIKTSLYFSLALFPTMTTSRPSSHSPLIDFLPKESSHQTSCSLIGNAWIPM